jgi:hypothetical protein
MQWLVVLLVALVYVHLFNALVRLHFESELTLSGLWHRFFPSVSIVLE